MQKIAITTKKEISQKDVLQELVQMLQEQQKEILLTEKAKANFPGKNVDRFETFDFSQAVDLIFVLGGDGTVLRCVRNLRDFSTPIFGINAGHLGFLSEIQPTDLHGIFNCLCVERFTTDRRMLLGIEIFNNGKLLKQMHALNEIVVGQGGVSRLIELPVTIDSMPIVNFRADGLIISTPTGSTAHSLSAGGPILHPKMQAIILTPISPHSFTQKPIVITAEKVIEILPKFKAKESLCLTIDGQVSHDLQQGDTVRISRFAEDVKFLRLLSENFFKTLRGKLGWGSGFNGGFES